MPTNATKNVRAFKDADFDFSGFVSGLKLDFDATAWGGPNNSKVGQNNKEREIRIRKPVKKTVKRNPPSILLLTETTRDAVGRTQEGHREKIRQYADKYSSGLYPFSGEEVTDNYELNTITDPSYIEPIERAKSRRGRVGKNEGDVMGGLELILSLSTPIPDDADDAEDY